MFPGFRSPIRNENGRGDDWTESPAEGGVTRWLGGVILPAGFVVYSIICFVTQRGHLPGSFVRPLPLQGAFANALGIAFLSAGVFLFSHFFCGGLTRGAIVGKIVGALGFILSLGWIIVRYMLGTQS